MTALAERIRAACRAHADRPALQIGADRLSYADLLRLAEACAHTIAPHMADGGRVGIVAQRTVEAYVAVLGAVLAGHPYVPINPKAPPERQRAIAAAARCSVYMQDAATAAAAAALAGEFGGTALAIAMADGAPDAAPTHNGRHAYVMFTSGTTGVPKGVAVRTDNVTSYIDAFSAIAPITPEDRCTQFFDLSFDLSVHDMFVTWANGACLCVPTDMELIDPVGFADRTGITVWFSVPSIPAMARRMRRLKPGAMPTIRLALFCGEPLPTSLAATFHEAAPQAQIWNLYGPTEATIAITAYRLDPAQADAMPATVPLGTAYDKCAVAVVDAKGQPLPAGESGELWLAGAQVTDGYINNPSEQADKFLDTTVAGYDHDRWYRSGDIVRNDPRWGLVYESRLDDQVKISGYRVELLEVEEAMRWAAQTAEVAAAPWPVNEAGAAEGITGFVVGLDCDVRQTIARCRERLPAYMVPSRILPIEAMPLNANGKIDRKALVRLYLQKP
jgi:amino acid adenylation domain-containing protein